MNVQPAHGISNASLRWQIQSSSFGRGSWPTILCTLSALPFLRPCSFGLLGARDAEAVDWMIPHSVSDMQSKNAQRTTHFAISQVECALKSFWIFCCALLMGSFSTTSANKNAILVMGKYRTMEVHLVIHCSMPELSFVP